MDTSTILKLVKARIGISSTVRNEYLTAIIEGVLTELSDEKGIVLEQNNYNQIMFIVDYSTWRYQNKDSSGAMPRDLQFRLHNMMIHKGGASSDI